MCHLGKRIVLIHKLRELAGAEKLFDGRRDRLGVDQILRHQAFTLRHGEPLFDGTLDAHQPYTELIFSHFADGPDAPVAKVINVVHYALAVADTDQSANNIDNVFLVEGRGTDLVLSAQPSVELHSAHGREIVSLGREKQILEEVFRRLFSGRLSRSHHAVDLNECLQHTAG